MNQLQLIEKMTPTEIYAPENIDTILKKIAEEVKSQKPDLSTASGRKEIASLAYKVAQSKTFMDECGKKLGEEAKKKLDTINAERKKVRDTLDELKDSVQKPLTEWKKAEEDRVRKHRDLLADAAGEANNMSNMWQTLDIEEMTRVLEETKANKNRDWQEFEVEALKVFDHAVEKIETAISRRKEYDEQQAELKKLREEKAARELAEMQRLEAERLANIAKEAAEEKARVEAKRLADEADRAKREADLRAELERQRVVRENHLAQEKVKAIQKEKELAEVRAKEAAQKAEQDKIKAVENERRRIEKEKADALEAEKKREANTKHRAKINNQVLAALLTVGVSEELGKEIIKAIVSGSVPHTKINY